MTTQYESIAQHFDTLPPELIHRILDDLPILKILEISLDEQASPYLNECIQSHQHFLQIFSSKEWEGLKECVRFWAKIHTQPMINNIPFFSIPVRGLEKSLAQAAESNEYSTDTCRDFQAEIRLSLAGYGWDTILQHYSPVSLIEWHFDLQDGLACLEARWRAEVIMNQAKEDQLRRMALLLQKYPEALRTAPDVRQESRRNTQHVVNQLLHEADIIAHSPLPKRTGAGRRVFARPTLYIVPLDRYLRVFLKILVKYPPTDESSFQAVQNLQASPPRQPVKRHEYPPAMSTTIEGLRNIYPKEGVKEPIMGRTSPSLPTPAMSPREARKNSQPWFYSTIDPSYGPFALAPDKEIEWLEAFLSTCTYISEMDEEWKPGQTVGDFWKAHI